MIRKKKKGIILDEDVEFRSALRKKLFDNEVDPIGDFDSVERLLEFLKKKKHVDFAFICLDTNEDIFSLIKQISSKYPNIDIITTSEKENVKAIIKSIRYGAKSFIVKPIYMSTLAKTITDIAYEKMKNEKDNRIKNILLKESSKSTTGLSILNIKKEVLWFNDRFAKLTEKEITKTKLEVIFPDGAVSTFLNERGVNLLPIESIIHPNTPKEKFVEVEAYSIDYKEDDYIIFKIRDISHFKRIEKAITRQLYNNQMINRMIPFGRIEAKSNGKILKYNSIASKIIKDFEFQDDFIKEELKITYSCNDGELAKSHKIEDIEAKLYLTEDHSRALLYYCLSISEIEGFEEDSNVVIFLMELSALYKVQNESAKYMKMAINELNAANKTLVEELEALKNISTDIENFERNIVNIYSKKTRKIKDKSIKDKTEGEISKLLETIITSSINLAQYKTKEAQIYHAFRTYRQQIQLFEKLSAYELSYKILSLLCENEVMTIEQIANITGLGKQILLMTLKGYERNNILTIEENNVRLTKS